MIRYRRGVDVLAMLADSGYTSYRMRHEHLMGERSMQKLRDGKLPSWAELDRLCTLIGCHPCDLLEYIPEPPGNTRRHPDTD